MVTVNLMLWSQEPVKRMLASMSILIMESSCSFYLW